jgi:hypothetical protein
VCIASFRGDCRTLDLSFLGAQNRARPGSQPYPCPKAPLQISRHHPNYRHVQFSGSEPAHGCAFPRVERLRAVAEAGKLLVEPAPAVIGAQHLADVWISTILRVQRKTPPKQAFRSSPPTRLTGRWEGRDSSQLLDLREGSSFQSSFGYYHGQQECQSCLGIGLPSLSAGY